MSAKHFAFLYFSITFCSSFAFGQISQDCTPKADDNACFIAAAMVATPKGLVSIAQIKADDMVYSFNRQTGKVIQARVTATASHAMKKTCNLNLDDGSNLKVTPNHEFFVANDLLKNDMNKLGQDMYSMKIGDLQLSTKGYVSKRYRTQIGEYDRTYKEVSLLKFLNPASIGDNSTLGSENFIKLFKFDSPERNTVYSIEVDVTHNYIVDGLLVHNKKM